MNAILRNFFYAFGIVALCSLYSLNPDTTTLKDIMTVLHSGNFWASVQGLSLLLIGIQVVMSADFHAINEMVKRLSSRKAV